MTDTGVARATLGDDTVEITRAAHGDYVLHATTWLAIRRDDVFPFFADAANLGVITPPELSFEIRSPLPIAMRVGTIIDYTIGLHGIPMRWRTEITAWDPPVSFTDTQLRGPYALWVHTHRFIDEGNATRMEDTVRYRLPFGLLGRLAHPIVRRQLYKIFMYRRDAVRNALQRGLHHAVSTTRAEHASSDQK